MAESTIRKNKRDFTVVLSDNATAHSYTIAFEPGDIAINVPGTTVSLALDRGRITSPPSIRYVDDQPHTITLSAYLRDISDASYATITEFIAGPSGYVGTTWVSTMGANGEVPTWTVTITVEGTDHGDAADHTWVSNYCYVTGSIGDGDPATVSLSITSYDVYPTVT